MKTSNLLKEWICKRAKYISIGQTLDNRELIFDHTRKCLLLWHFSVKSLLWRDFSSGFSHAFFFSLTRHPKPLCLSPLDWKVWCSVRIHFLTVKAVAVFSARLSRTSNILAQALPSFWCPWLGFWLNHWYHAPSSSALTFPLRYPFIPSLRHHGYCITLVPRV